MLKHPHEYILPRESSSDDSFFRYTTAIRRNRYDECFFASKIRSQDVQTFEEGKNHKKGSRLVVGEKPNGKSQMKGNDAFKVCVVLSLLLGNLISGTTCFSQAASPWVRPIGMEGLAHPEYLPFFYPVGTQTFQFASYDLGGGNYDGSFTNAFTKYIDPNGEFVIFDAFGPGSLNRQQINIWQFVKADRSFDYGFRILYSPGAGESRIRYYFDGETKPRIDLSVDEFFGGMRAPFDKPFSFTGSFDDREFKDLMLESMAKDLSGTDREFYSKLISGELSESKFEILLKRSPLLRARIGDLSLADLTRRILHGKAFAVQYYPLPFAKRLKITFVPSAAYKEYIASLKGELYGTSWYQFTYLLYPPDAHVSSWSKDEPSSDAVRAAWSHVGEDPKATAGNIASRTSASIAPGQTAMLLDSKGQGSVASLRIRMAPYSEDTFFNVRIRMSWDGGARSAVDMPIGVFFGGGAGDYSDRSTVPSKRLSNLFYGFDGKQGSFYCYWPMPYWTSAKIEVINNSSQTVNVAADVQVKPKALLNYPSGEAGHFYAKETKDADPGDGLFASAFREQGYGHVVGISFYSQGYAMDGDEFTYFDGSRTPQVHGDGTEDDHNQGWGGAGFQQPLWGGVISGTQGAYRIYANDPYVFEDQVKINYEYSRVPAMTNSKADVVIYYYKTTGLPRLMQTDSIDIGVRGSEKAHDYSIEGQTWEGSLRSAFDGYEKDVEAGTFLEEGRAFNGDSAFTVTVDPKNEGVRLRRLLSRIGNGVQSAEVYVDGIKVERPWQVVFNSSAPENQAWVESDFELPASLTHGKAQLRIELKYLSSTKGEINEFHYWVFCHVRFD